MANRSFSSELSQWAMKCRLPMMTLAALLLAIAGLYTPVFAQAGGNQTSPAELPDSPKPQNNAPPPPVWGPAPTADPVAQPAQPSTAAASPPPSSTPPGPPPANPITTVPPGSAPNDPGNTREQLFTLTKNVNFVLVPVTVKANNGQLVHGLLQKDFSIYEDGQRQKITFFTSDPFPLSAALVLDTGMQENVWRRIRDTLSALVGAFSQFDEVSIFTYGNTVHKEQGFTGVDAALLESSLRNLRKQTGKMGGVPVVGGPFSGPSINGIPVQPGAPQMPTYTKESHVLNDAVLAAANELSKRDPRRRKILFVVSDGREVGSANGYSDVVRVLLTHQIQVYAVSLAGGGVPGFRQLERIRIPGQGYGNILPKYASATGGQLFEEFDQKAIEEAYSRITEEARNQYTIGYNTALRPSSTYRTIEVRVVRPSLRIYAKDGYYPLPPGRQDQ